MMKFHWGYKVVFLLENLKSTSDKKALFFFGLFVSFLFGFISQYLKPLKKKLAKKKAPKSSIFLLEIGRYTLDCLCMLLLMTFNWNVVLCVIFGQILGFYLGFLDKNKDGKFKDDSWIGGNGTGVQVSTMKGMGHID